MRSTVLLPASIVALVATSASPARALQPLEAFLAGAATQNPDVRVARATATQRDAEVSKSTAPLLPSFEAKGTYTRNQYDVSFPASALGGSGGSTGQTLTIQPLNQLDATLALTVPIVDIGGWMKRSAAKETRSFAEADARATVSSIAKKVVQQYFQTLANEAVLDAAKATLAYAQENASLSATKREAGTASELDVQRARGDVARAEQDLATANLQLVTARRSLESLSGVMPEPGGVLPPDDLHREGPLAQWLGETDRNPNVQSALAARRSAESSVNAAKSAWLPTITGTAQERFTNAPSLALRNNYYTLLATASWKLDFSVPATVRQQNAAASVAVAKADKARRDAGDAIFDDWHQIEAGLAKTQAARAQVASTTAAAALAAERYRGGIATQIDVLQAEQDAFKAQVARIQAEADLAYARAALRLDSSQNAPGTER